MHKTEHISARIESDIKHKAEAILKTIGLSNSRVINLLYKSIIINKGLPFDLRIPNEETQEVLRDALLGRNLSEPMSLEEFNKDFEEKYL